MFSPGLPSGPEGPAWRDMFTIYRNTTRNVSAYKGELSYASILVSFVCTLFGICKGRLARYHLNEPVTTDHSKVNGINGTLLSRLWSTLEALIPSTEGVPEVCGEPGAARDDVNCTLRSPPSTPDFSKLHWALEAGPPMPQPKVAVLSRP